MIRPCVTWLPCIGDDDGVLNLSSEDPDPLIFTGIGYTPATDYDPPPLGESTGVIKAQDCFGVAFSVQSQAIANQIARLNARLCVKSRRGSGGTPVSPTTGRPISPTDGRAGGGSGGGGGGGGGNREKPRQGPGGRSIPTISSLRPSFCAGEDVIPSDNTYTLKGARPGTEYVISIQGNLPPGISLTTTGPSSAALTGETTQESIGIYPYIVTAAPVLGNGEAGGVVARTFDSISVLGITDGPPPIGDKCEDYSGQLVADGGQPEFLFAIEEGTLPPGITMDENGTFSGRPTDVGTFNFTVSVTDAFGLGCNTDFTITVPETDCFSSGNPPDADVVAGVPQPYSFTFVPAHEAAEGTTCHFTITAGSLPPGLNLNELTGVLSGTPDISAVNNQYTFTVSVTQCGCDCSKEYSMYVRCYPNVQEGFSTMFATLGNPQVLYFAQRSGSSKTLNISGNGNISKLIHGGTGLNPVHWGYNIDFTLERISPPNSHNAGTGASGILFDDKPPECQFIFPSFSGTFTVESCALFRATLTVTESPCGDPSSSATVTGTLT